MIVFYIDESGTGAKDRNSNFFVLAAFALADAKIRVINESVAHIKQRLCPWARPQDFELKGRDLRRGDKVFKRLTWQERSQAFLEVAQQIADGPGDILAVIADKGALPEERREEDLYRFAVTALLRALNESLLEQGEKGVLLFDSRSDLHNSVQDRRVLDAYLEWERSNDAQLIELPLFGFSEFYAGLQMADFAAYLIGLARNTELTASGDRGEDLLKAYECIVPKLKTVEIP